MKRLRTICVVLLLAGAADAAGYKQYLLRMSADDTFTVAETENWNVKVLRYETQRHADVKVTPRTNTSFSLALNFRCDTGELANFDTQEKMKAAVLHSAERYLGTSVEKTVLLLPINQRGRYGFSTILTDATLEKQALLPAGKFKFATRGMVRLSTDSALGFTLMTNDVTSKEYKELMDYILSFVQPAG